MGMLKQTGVLTEGLQQKVGSRRVFAVLSAVAIRTRESPFLKTADRDRYVGLVFL